MIDYQSSTGAADTPSDPGGFLVMLVLLYFAPSIIAFHRMHHKRRAIQGLNKLLGWSVLGWIVAFGWALTAVRKGDPCNKQAHPGNCENQQGIEDGFSPI